MLNDENDIENHQIVPPLMGLSTVLDNPAANVPETNDINLFRERIMFLEVIGLAGRRKFSDREKNYEPLGDSACQLFMIRNLVQDPASRHFHERILY